MDNETPSNKPRGLWEVMRQERSSASSETTEGPADPEEIESADAEQSQEDSASASQSRGLWAMMGVQPPLPAKSLPAKPRPAESPGDANEVDLDEARDKAQTAPPPPDWFHTKRTSDETPASEESPESEAIDEREMEIPLTETPDDKPPAVEKPEIETPASREPKPTPFLVTSDDASAARAKRETLQVKTGRSRGALISLLVGLFAIPMSFLAMRPEIWTRIPAAVLGFGALVLGLISFNEIQRSRGRQTGTGFAMTGMILGTIAMFLGPLVIAPWSAQRNQAGKRSITRQHLESVGSALKTYHQKHRRYPPGGTYRVEESGETIAYHSWMTKLLPYLDAQGIFHDIRQEAPWNASSNKPPLSQSVPAFLAGGVETTHNSQGYGVSHFAGLGGREKVNSGRMANVGIFERNSQVTDNDIRDGKSQTLIAGEISENYRPWGEPGNWRTIGDGLNRGSTSFGNAKGTGAMFLKADGSVQFLSNQVSADVLKRLSTRDGEDNRLIPEKYR